MKAAIVTEGFNGIGYGHLTRCLAIYQAFEERGITPTYIADSAGIDVQFLGRINLVVLDWRKNSDELLRLSANSDVIVIDSYLADLQIYERLRQASGKTIYLDDYLRIDYPPGIIVNGTVGAEKLPYPRDRDHRHLLGIEYVPLRREFWDISPLVGGHDTKDVLLNFGGEDARNLAARTLRHLLEAFPEYTYHVVRGLTPGEANSEFNSQRARFYRNLQAGELLRLVMSCDLAISAAGQTLYELARIGLPTIAVATAENQRHTIQGWVENGFLRSELWWNDDDLFEKLACEIRACSNPRAGLPAFCDGQGARRIVQYMAE